MNRCSIFKRRRGLLRVVVAILLIAAPTALTACRARSATQEVEATIVVRDGRGRAVRLPRPARRIAALSPSAVEILFRLGCGARVVLRSKMANFPPRARSIPSTDGLRLAAEHIVGFRPDLVLLSHLDPSGVAALEGLGIPVGVFEPRSIEEVFGDMETLGRLCGASGMRLRQEVATLRHRAEAIDRRVAGLRPAAVYVELDGTDLLKPWTLGGGSFLSDVVKRAGGHNIFWQLGRSYVQVSAEAVIAKAPEVIVIAGGGQRGAAARLRARPAWTSVPAVRVGRVIDTISPDVLSRPGPRVVDGLEALARALHPVKGQTP